MFSFSFKSLPTESPHTFALDVVKRWVVFTFTLTGFSSALAQVPHTGEQQSNRRPPDSRWHWQAALASHYLSEGRDILAGQPLAFVSAEWGQSHWSTGLWLAHSPSVNYSEGQAYLTYSNVVQLARDIPLEWYAAYNRVQVIDESGDNEWSAGLSWTDTTDTWELALDSTYSTTARGGFTEATGRYHGLRLPKADEASLAAHVGWNGGYVADGHRGWNHVSVDVQWQKPWFNHGHLAVTTGYTHALDRQRFQPGDDNLMTGFFLELAWQWTSSTQ